MGRLMLGWAKSFPEFKEALVECVEEINPSLFETLGEVEPAGLRHDFRDAAQMIITTVSLWSEVHSEHSRALESLVDEIQDLSRPLPQTKIGKVYQAMKDGYRTIPDLLTHTKLQRKSVQNVLDGLIEIGLALPPVEIGERAQMSQGTEIREGAPVLVYRLKGVIS
ncbi:MAG: hypothetical protein WCB68_12635 [Pyrinomonadaceae bacterium]